MRHRIFGKQLNRDSEHRTAMLRNLAAGLFEHGEIQTTLPKAKAVQPFVEKIITAAKPGGLHARRKVEKMLNDRHVHVWVADSATPARSLDNDYFELPSADKIEFNRYGELRKAPRLIQHIMEKVVPMFESRNGGYTRIIKLPKHRLGDGADLVVMQLVKEGDERPIPSKSSHRRSQAEKRVAFAAGDNSLESKDDPNLKGSDPEAVATPDDTGAIGDSKFKNFDSENTSSDENSNEEGDSDSNK